MSTHSTALRDLLRERGQLLRFLLSAVVLALGCNLLASEATHLIPRTIVIGNVSIAHPVLVFAIALVLAPLLYLAHLVQGRRRFEIRHEAFFVYDPDESTLVEVPQYEFAESLKRAVDAKAAV